MKAHGDAAHPQKGSNIAAMLGWGKPPHTVAVVGKADVDCRQKISIHGDMDAIGLAANGATANGLAANGLAANGATANGFAAWNGKAENSVAGGGLWGIIMDHGHGTISMPGNAADFVGAGFGDRTSFCQALAAAMAASAPCR